jgi:hypothetical protein
MMYLKNVVDKTRLGCVGARLWWIFGILFAGGILQQTFIAHDGVFTQSMFGTTEEVFFSNWDFGGPYWEKDNATAQNLYYIQPY